MCTCVYSGVEVVQMWLKFECKVLFLCVCVCVCVHRLWPVRTLP